jgi:hypothetical protein
MHVHAIALMQTMDNKFSSYFTKELGIIYPDISEPPYLNALMYCKTDLKWN